MREILEGPMRRPRTGRIDRNGRVSLIRHMARHPALVNIRSVGFPALALLALAGCAYLPPMPERPRDVFTAPITNRGHAVSDEQIAQLTPGVSTRSDVQALLGSPSQSGTFSDENWYYISSVTQLRPGRTEALRSQRVVAITFDNRGAMTQVRQLSQADMPQITAVARETPSPGNERSVLQALFGNVGRFGPGAAGAGGPGVAGPQASTGR